MKRIQNILAIFLLIAATSMTAQSQEEVTIAADEKVDANFEQYKTFALAKMTTDGTMSTVTPDDQTHMDNQTHMDQMPDMSTDLKSTIKEAVMYEMEVRGYEKATSDTGTETKADLLVTYQILEEPTDLKGYANTTETIGGNAVIEPQNMINYDLKAGTLIIQLVDAEQGSVVWRGFASGLLDKEAITMSQDDYAMQDKDRADVDTEYDSDVDVDMDDDADIDADVDVDRDEDMQGEMQQGEMRDTYGQGMTKLDEVNKKAKQAVHHIFREFEHTASELAISRSE